MGCLSRQLKLDCDEASVAVDMAVSVKDPPYNAKGDGIADDTVALQAAWSAEADVYVPPGEYILGTSYPSGYEARGIGPYNLVVKNRPGFRALGAGQGVTTFRT